MTTGIGGTRTRKNEDPVAGDKQSNIQEPYKNCEMADKTKHSNDEIFELLSAMAVDLKN